MNTQDLKALREELTGALIGLSRACRTNPKTDATDALLVKGLADTLTGDSATLRETLERVRGEKDTVAPNCRYCAHPCGATADFPPAGLLRADSPNRGLKLMLLDMLSALAVRLQSAPDADTAAFVADTLRDLPDDWETDGLVQLMLRAARTEEKYAERMTHNDL